MTIQSYCKSNKDFQDILEVFTQTYMPEYNKRKVKDRKAVKIYLHRNFGRWYYSMLEMGDLSPANFINSDVQNKLDRNVMVFPVCNPVFKGEKLIEIHYEFNVFHLDDHPFMKDMKTFMHLLPDREITVDDDSRVYIPFEDSMQIVNDKELSFTFKEAVYLDVIANVCVGLGMAAAVEMGQGKRLVADDAGIKTFFGLTVKDQFTKIITANAEMFLRDLESINQLEKIPSVAQVLDTLKNGMEAGDFFEVLFEEVMENILPLGLDGMDELFDDDINAFDNLDEQSIFNIFQAKFVSSLVYRDFFLVYGQYLQLIQPLYRSYYDNDCDEAYLFELNNSSGKEKNEKISPFFIYMISPDCYKLSPLGVHLLRKGKREKNPVFDDVMPEEYEEVLEGMLDAGSTADDYGSKSLEDLSLLFESLFEKPGVVKPLRQKDFSPLKGLNPQELPVFEAEEAEYRFKVKPYYAKREYKTVTMAGVDTLSMLADKIVAQFDLESMRLYSFYMGKKFLEREREIPSPDCEQGGLDASEHMICELGLFKKQKFLFLYDFGSEERFEIEFMG